ncbi:MAG: RNA polymerase-binding protein DksA [Gammaproteobacteria bacterium]|nr:MAG: RNA polymerase-binding protein DksA [Gammaproteobacteria bacterium]
MASKQKAPKAKQAKTDGVVTGRGKSSASAKRSASSGKTKASKTSSAKSPARKAATTVKKTSVKKTSAKKATAKKTAAKSTAKKAAAGKKAVAKKTAAKKTAAKATATKKAPAKSAPAKKPAAKAATAKQSQSTATSGRKTTVSLLAGPMHGFKPYQPQAGEEYMGSAQLEHFRQILQTWKRQLMEEVDRTVHHMQDEAANFPDPNDRATQESEFSLELRTRDRERKLLRKIDSALLRIENGEYGFCEETGEEIGLRRLEARPVATLCLEAQERRELAERQYGERDDRYR